MIRPALPVQPPADGNVPCRSTIWVHNAAQVELQDKLIEDRDAAQVESQQREEIEEHGKDELPEPVTEAVRDATVARRAQLLGAIRMILDRQKLDIDRLGLPARELKALEALQVAVEGKSLLDAFVYASDRRDLLEGALAVLQPDLTHADSLSAHELHAQLADMAERVGVLRDELSDLEDAQDELLEDHEEAVLEAVPGPPKPKPVPSDPDAPRPATTLTGPDVPEPAPAPTTLTGPDVPEPVPAPTTLTGPDVPEPVPAPTTLAGPDVPEDAPAPSTLGADDASAAPASFAADDGAKAKRPWWRRPFG